MLNMIYHDIPTQPEINVNKSSTQGHLPLAARCCWITWSPRLYADLCWLVMWCFGCSNIWWVPKESPNSAARDLWFLEAQPSFRSKINKSLETPYFCFTVQFDIMQQTFVGGFGMSSTRRVCLEHRGYHKISLFIIISALKLRCII